MLQLVYCLFLPNLRKSWLSMLSCCLLLSALAALQILHAEHLFSGLDLVSLQPYLSLLFLVPTAFFFFSRAVLLPDHPPRPILILHWVPFVASVFIASPVELPAAFLLGAAYCVWLSRKIYGIRTQRSRFRFEIFFFGLFSLLAIGVLLLGFAINQIDQSNFVLAYANAIGLALVLVVAALIIFPELLSDIDAIAKLAYANSTLTHVDTRAAVARLDTLMKSEKIFQNEELSLSVLAEQLALSSHQLSELVNTEYGIGFSRLVRKHRVEEAKRLLLDEPQSSVLSIGLEVGFRSQSNFYTAFKEFTGISPGQFRADPDEPVPE